MKPEDDRPTPSGDLALAPPRRQEQLLIDTLAELDASRVVCTSAGLGQFARAAALRVPHAQVYCHYFDVYHAEQARRAVGGAAENLTIGCAADLPAEEANLAAFPFSSQGEAELTRELMQCGHQLLAAGGRMIVSTDNPRDKWLQGEMEKLFDAVTRRATDDGAVYLATKTRPLKRVIDFSCEFAFRDRGRLIAAVSRPGVFAHRRIDPGARQLLAAMEVAPGERVLDIGCGCGTVALAAALRAEGVRVHAVDSHARAVQCTRLGAERNALGNLSVELNATGDYLEGPFDLALANPPYYANFQIAEHFLLSARASLRPGGRVLVVTKSPKWYAQRMGEWFEAVRIEPSKDYHLAFGRRPE